MDVVRLVEDVALVAFVLTIIYTDWRSRRIPNAVTYPAMAIGLVLGGLESATGPFGFPGQVLGGGLLDHAVALVAAFVVSYPIFVGGWMKGGDGKFLMAVGALRGTTFLISAGLWGAVLGGVIAVAFIVLRRLVPATEGGRSTMTALLHSWIPYGVALGLGALLALALELRRLS